MKQNNQPDHDPLDGFFSAARNSAPAPSYDFMARVLADAVAAQPVRTVASRPRRSMWWEAMAALGGGLGLTGLSTAAMAGLLIGYVQPDAMLALGDTYGLTADVGALDLTSGFDTLLIEDTAP